MASAPPGPALEGSLQVSSAAAAAHLAGPAAWDEVAFAPLKKKGASFRSIVVAPWQDRGMRPCHDGVGVWPDRLLHPLWLPCQPPPRQLGELRPKTPVEKRPAATLLAPAPGLLVGAQSLIPPLRLPAPAGNAFRSEPLIPTHALHAASLLITWRRAGRLPGLNAGARHSAGGEILPFPAAMSMKALGPLEVSWLPASALLPRGQSSPWQKVGDFAPAGMAHSLPPVQPRLASNEAPAPTACFPKAHAASGKAVAIAPVPPAALLRAIPIVYQVSARRLRLVEKALSLVPFSSAPGVCRGLEPSEVLPLGTSPVLPTLRTAQWTPTRNAKSELVLPPGESWPVRREQPAAVAAPCDIRPIQIGPGLAPEHSGSPWSLRPGLVRPIGAFRMTEASPAARPGITAGPATVLAPHMDGLADSLLPVEPAALPPAAPTSPPPNRSAAPPAPAPRRASAESPFGVMTSPRIPAAPKVGQIGRASCRERVYVLV